MFYSICFFLTTLVHFSKATQFSIQDDGNSISTLLPSTQEKISQSTVPTTSFQSNEPTTEIMSLRIQSDPPTPRATPSKLPTQSNSPKPSPSYPQSLKPTFTPTGKPSPTQTPKPEVDHSKDIYVCEGTACEKCGKTDEEDNKIQLRSFSLLDQLLTQNDQDKIEITICGSTRSNNPQIKLSHIEKRRIEFKGKKNQQFLTFINDSHISDKEIEHIIEFESENVTIIVDESDKKQNLVINYAELEDSPIEVENLTLIDFESDLTSLLSVKNKILAVSSKINDNSITKIEIGNDYITFNPSNVIDQNSKKKIIKKSSVTLNAVDDSVKMDIWISLKQTQLEFTTSQNLEQINGIQNLVIDIKNDDDKKATISFDNTWSSLLNLDFILIKHTCNLDIISVNNDIAKKIGVIGSGTVTRNGQVDGETLHQKKKIDYLTIIIICLIVVLVILLALALFLIFRKKCKRHGGTPQNYNEYLNNSEELDPINLPA